jgi:hypothetical protein
VFVDEAAYSYLLGIYLGDGHVGIHGRTARFVVALDAGYPAIIDEVLAAARAVAPTARVTVHDRPGQQCRYTSSYARTWLELFPQHGPGPKHERSIVLAGWQRAIVDAHPRPFLRGLIQSDGCRTMNRFTTLLPSGRVAEYAYPRYFFSNLSSDIRGLFCEYCDRLGIRWTQSNHRNISISHRHSVAAMDAFIGPKA